MKRRSFLNALALITGSLTISHPFELLANNPQKNNIQGKVSSNGKGLSNVVVSDGYSVIVTDNMGNYELPYHPDAEFVFVTTPSGYEFKRENNIAGDFFKVSSSTYNFDLTKLKKEDNHHRFIVWADPQIQDQNDAQQLINESVPDLLNHLKSFPKAIPVHGISVGDLIWDKKELWTDYKKAVSLLGIPFYQALGNHDMDYDQGGDKESDRTFKSHFGPTYYSFNRGQAHYIILDDVRYLGPGKKYDGYITDNQLDWLRKDLEHVDKNKVIFIGLHIPVYNSVKNRSELYNILEPFSQVHILAGHTHTNKNNIHKNVYEHVHGTLCGAWWTGPICKDGTPRGYGVYDIKGTDVNWYYKSIGQKQQHQFRTDIEKLNNGTVRLLTNVWNFDPEWKVEWWENNTFKGNMEKTKGVDPLALKLYQGKELPKERRGWIEPGKTDHLFLAHSSAGMKIKIQITDRFQNKYIEKIKL